MSQIITIEEKIQGQRLDKFLAENLPDKTRSQIKKMIRQSLVLVNNKPAKVHQFLKAGNTVSVVDNKLPPEAISLTKENLPTYSPRFAGEAGQPTNLLPKIIFKDNDFLVLEKPAGLLVHPTEKGEKDTLVDWLLKEYPEIKNVGEERYREGIIHRLDKDVSGIMLVAKTKEAYFRLKEQFKQRLVKKKYLALVYGRMEKLEGEIDLPIGRNKEGQFVAHPRLGQAKLLETDRFAKTQYKVLEYLKDYTLLSVQILTGRTHQIRAHLCAIGHPILGDLIYKPKKKYFHFLRRKIKVVDPGRIFLHATKIGFYDLKKEWVEFNSPLPQDLTKFLNDQKAK